LWIIEGPSALESGTIGLAEDVADGPSRAAAARAENSANLRSIALSLMGIITSWRVPEPW
jgi:hypothetical protein